MDNFKVIDYGKYIPGYEGLYSITRDGKIYSYRRKKFLKLGYSGRKSAKNYLKIELVKDKKSKFFKVHRLVAQTYIPNPENKETVDHINRDITDNRVENLRWATFAEQMENRNCGGIRIKDLQTDIVYNSITAAALSLHKSTQYIKNHIVTDENQKSNNNKTFIKI